MNKNITRTLIIFLIIVMTPFPAFAVNEDYIPIHIDGEYDDWDDKPFTEVYPGHNPPASKINYVSLFRDEDNVYVHVTFAYKNNQDITNMIINLYTNMGNESYFLVPDYFWPMDMQSEPDMTLDQSTSLAPPEQAPAGEEGGGTESADQNAPTEQGGTTEPTETTEQDTATPDQGGTSESTETTNTPESSDASEQNILAGHEAASYILVADNDKTDPAADPAAVSDPASAGEDTTTVTTDEKTNNGQGNGPETNNGQGSGPETNNVQGSGAETPSTDTSTDSGIGTNPAENADLGDLLDILDPGNLVDLNNALDQFATGGAIDSSPANDLDDLNSNLNLKKPGWYGTWGFSVWDGLFPVGSGYYTRSEGEPDELEFYIPLSSVAHHYDGITEISMRIKKLGPQYIMCSGVSTGAYIGVAAGAGIALLSVGAYTFKRKRPFVLGKGK